MLFPYSFRFTSVPPLILVDFLFLKIRDGKPPSRKLMFYFIISPGNMPALISSAGMEAGKSLPIGGQRQ